MFFGRNYRNTPIMKTRHGFVVFNGNIDRGRLRKSNRTHYTELFVRASRGRLKKVQTGLLRTFRKRGVFVPAANGKCRRPSLL